ncbi:glutamine synthetase family protein [Streptomyces sp. NPDC102383]|uniref:glutamine synthetase family protein n=1 Tax=Streptomyces sp. NPDC102383 TaxID=3366165 RepID=UPI0037FDF88D
MTAEVRTSTPIAPKSPSATTRETHRGARSTVGRLSPGTLKGLVADGRLDTVLLALPDLQGRLKGKRFEAGHFTDRVLAQGADMCAYLLATDVAMRPLDGFPLASWESGYQDLRVVPDVSTLRMVPWLPRTALLLGDAVTQDNQPIEVAPRQMLQTQLARLAGHGLEVKAGVETEFVLYNAPAGESAALQGSLRPATEQNLDYALGLDGPLGRYLRRLQAALLGAGHPVEAVKTEAAPGQVEVTFPYGPALAACDGHLLFKHAAKSLAHAAGMAATFMAAPQTGVASGLHIHLSLWQQNRPQHAAADGTLSPITLQAVAGLLDTLPQLAPLYAPTVNSYKRYRPASFAPTRMTWGQDNRTCAVRVVGHGEETHLEIRLPGADANPYLALAAIVAAITDGLDRALKPPTAHAGNAYAAHAPLVPVTLEQASDSFRASSAAREAFGESTVAHYARLADVEIDAHRAVVTDAERHRWLTDA